RRRTLPSADKSLPRVLPNKLVAVGVSNSSSLDRRRNQGHLSKHMAGKQRALQIATRPYRNEGTHTTKRIRLLDRPEKTLANSAYKRIRFPHLALVNPQMKCRQSFPFVRQDAGLSLFRSVSGTVLLLRSSNSASATRNQGDNINHLSRS